MSKPIFLYAFCMLSLACSHGQKLRDFNFEEPTRGIDVIELKDGGYLLTGNALSRSGQASSILVKTNDSGELIWKKNLDLTIGSSFGWSLLEFRNFYYLLGFSDSQDTTKVQLTKLDQTGLIIWKREYGKATSQIGWSLTARNEDLLIVGEKTGKDGKKSAWIFSVDQQGDKIWDAKTDGKGRVERTFYGSRVSGDVIVTGINAMNEKVDDDILAMRIDQVGEVVWKKTFEVGKKRDVGHAVKAYKENAYIYGYFQLESTFNPVVIQVSLDGNDSNIIKVQVPDHDVRIMNGEKIQNGHLLVGYAKKTSEQFFKACILRVSETGKVVSMDTFGEQGLNSLYGVKNTGNGYAIIGTVTENRKAALTLVLLPKD
ncbi:MAG: hypothetical protein ABJP45_00700 [Cyclobacteriaceae bacterium]